MPYFTRIEEMDGVGLFEPTTSAMLIAFKWTLFLDNRQAIRRRNNNCTKYSIGVQ
jgi:hypothetical protein